MAVSTQSYDSDNSLVLFNFINTFAICNVNVYFIKTKMLQYFTYHLFQDLWYCREYKDWAVINYFLRVNPLVKKPDNDYFTLFRKNSLRIFYFMYCTSISVRGCRVSNIQIKPASVKMPLPTPAHFYFLTCTSQGP